MSGRHKYPQFGLRIPTELRERLEKYCKDREVPMSAVILEALNQYLSDRLF